MAFDLLWERFICTIPGKKGVGKKKLVSMRQLARALPPDLIECEWPSSLCVEVKEIACRIPQQLLSALHSLFEMSFMS